MLVGVLGCMAERLKDQLLGVADLVAGPDAYRLVERERDITTSFSTIHYPEHFVLFSTPSPRKNC